MAQKHVVCRRCSHLLRPAPQGTPINQVEYLPHTQCPRCSLDDSFIDWEQADLREHEIEQSNRWLEAVAPGLSEYQFERHMKATPTLRSTEQMRRNRLYLESVENFSSLWTDSQSRFLKSTPRISRRKKDQMREGTYEQFEIDALQQISNRLGKEEADERFLYENHISHGAVRPLELQYGFKAPMSQGPEFVARQVQQKTDDMLERQRIRQQDPRYRIRQSWSGDLVSAFTPAEDLPNLPVPGLGKRMYLDPNWTSAPPRTEPWPPGSAPDWSAPDSSFLFQPRPYDFYEARDANNYPDAAAAYAPNLLSPGSTNPSQQSGSSNPPLMGSANRNQDHGARVTSKSKSKTHSAIQHHFSRPASGTPNPARYPPNAFTNAFTSPGNLGRDRSTANPLARTASAAPQVHASAPNLYKSPYNSLGAQSTTRSLSRTASAAPSSRGIGGLSHSVQPAARSLARTYSSAPVRPGSVQIPGNDFGMTPMANAPATAPAFPQVPNVGMGQNTNPWASVAPPPFQAPGPAPATAPPNNNNAQGGNTSGTSGVNITRTTFGGAN